MSTPQPQAKKAESAREIVPIDHSNPLKPTHALSITHTKHKTIIIQDLSPSLPSLFTTNGLVIDEATKLIDATPAPPTLYTLKKENLLGTHLTVHDKEGKEIAEWNNPILTLHAGKITIKFLGEEPNTVTVKPLSHERVSESFELNNKTYIWEAESKHHEFKHLYEVTEETKTAPPPEAPTSAPEGEAVAPPIITTKKAREVARYVQKHVHGHGHAGGKEGLLVIDSAAVGELIAALTLIALLEKNIHKEERFEKAYDNVVGLVA